MHPEYRILRFKKFLFSSLSPLRITNVPKLRYFGVVSLRQCSTYASVRIQRLLRMINLYKLLYNERSVGSLLRNFYGRWYRDLFTRPRLHGGAFGSSLLMSATAFSFVDNGINDEEMLKATDLVNHAETHKKRDAPSSSDDLSAANNKSPNPRTATIEKKDAQPWESLINKDHFKVQRRPMRGHPDLYEYRCSGTYKDITPTAFFIAQMDLEYRKQWDRLVVSLDIVDAEKNSGSEVIRWVSHFPYPMYPREYVYLRRACADTRQGTFVLQSKSVDHPSCPRDDSKLVRVDAYYSCMVIKAHGSVDENGVDYVLTYFDDPKAPFPQIAYDWMVDKGVFGFLEKVHNAAKALVAKRPSQSDQNGVNSRVANWQRLISERYSYTF